jgi:hypothetical protein
MDDREAGPATELARDRGLPGTTAADDRDTPHRVPRGSGRPPPRRNLSIDVSAPNIPDDQVWCVTARGSAGRQTFGPATACESEEF